jgi:O-antigen/teichoic acid export membrane protein
MQILKHSAIYLGSSILGKLIPFLLLPILTAYLTTEEFGTWSVYQVLMAFMVPFVGLNLHNNITRRFFARPKEETAVLVANMIWIVLVNVLLVTFLIFLFRKPLEALLSIESFWLLLLPLIALMSMMKMFYMTLLRNRKMAWRYGALEIAYSILTFCVAAFLIVVWGWKWDGMASAMATAMIVFGVLGLVMIYRGGYFKANVDPGILRELLMVSIPFVPHAVGGIVINMSDRLFIDQMIGKGAVGIYSVGFMFGMIVSIIMGAFNKAWSPWLHEQLVQISPEKKIQIVKVTYFLVFLVLLLPLFIWGASMVLLPFMVDDPYLGAEEYIVWIAYGYAIQSLYFFVFPYLIHTGKTIYLAKVTCFAAMVNLIGNFILIRYNGALGAAQSTIIAYTIMSLGIWYHATKVYPMPWSVRMRNA